MPKALSWSDLILGAASALLLALPQASAQNLPAPAGELIIVDKGRTLTARQRAGFAEFAEDAEYQGVFFVSSRGGWSWQRDVNTMEAAEVVTKAACEQNGGTCTLYARIVPKPAPGRKALDGLAHAYAVTATRWMKVNRSSRQGGAIAASPFQGYHSSTRRDVTQARRDALRQCQGRFDDRVEGRLKTDRIDALKAAGLYDCRIVVQFRNRD